MRRTLAKPLYFTVIAVANGIYASDSDTISLINALFSVLCSLCAVVAWMDWVLRKDS